MVRTFRFAGSVLAVAALIYLAGCSRSPSDPPRADEGGKPGIVSSGKEAGHAHKAGNHGGTVVEIGRDRYHAEAVFEKDAGLVRLFTLGSDEAVVQEVETQTPVAYAKSEGTAEATSIVFTPEPRPDDAAGKTSQFVARLPRELWSKRLEITIPALRINGERFRVAFDSAAGGHEEAEPPAKVADEAERNLYLTPGGKYTASDVDANGRITASEKFKGMMAAHDSKPQAGDKVCPITQTKANPKFTWIVGGKTYEFCCPPCVDEFVQTAKDRPETIKDPTAYVKEK